MSGLGDDPRTVRPTHETVGLLQLLGGIEESRLTSLIRSVTAGANSAPRLKYEWPRCAGAPLGALNPRREEISHDKSGPGRTGI
jgi:hypothetical protein